MAFKASDQIPANGYARAKSVAVRLKTRFTSELSKMVSGGYSADAVVALRDDAINADAELAAVASVPGIVAYAKDQEDDQNYNVSTEFTALRAAVQLVKTGVETLFPTSSGYLLKDQFPTGSGLTPRTFTAAQLGANTTPKTGLALLVENVINAID